MLVNIRLFILSLFYCMVCHISAASASEIQVSSIEELNTAIAEANGGDVIVIMNGTYVGPRIEFINSRGSAGSEIIVRAETPGSVIIEGDATSVIMRGPYLILEGIHFRQNSEKVSGVFLGIEGSEHWRVTNCTFDNIHRIGGVVEVRGLSADASEYYGPSRNGRLDHCTFNGNRRIEIENFFVDKESQAQPDLGNINNRYDHNVFKNHMESSQEEAFQIGRGSSLWGDGTRGWMTEYNTDAYTTIEYNIFQNFHGDNELISNKSSSNTIRYNKVIDCKSTITLRGGDDCTVEGNWILWTGDEYGSSAIRVSGANHKIINNYTENTFSGIFLYNGSIESSYMPIVNALIANNTIINCYRNAIYVGYGSKGTVSPDRTHVVNNIVHEIGADKNCYAEDPSSTNTTYETNIAWFINNGHAGVSDPGIIVTDPDMVYDGTLYRLQAGSINAIDQGTAHAFVIDDLDGQQRISMDIGADEYSSDPVMRNMITEGIGGAGVQWPNSTLDNLTGDINNDDGNLLQIKEYMLSQNYPNPLNPSTTISFEIPKTNEVTLKVYDITGREVATLVNELKNAGRYDVNFDASHLSSGVYIYQLRAGKFVQIKKLMLVK